MADEKPIRAGRFRVVSAGNDRAIIVEVDGPFTELNQPLILTSPGGSMSVENCAAMLCHCLNGCFNTYDLPMVLARASVCDE